MNYTHNLIVKKIVAISSLLIDSTYKEVHAPATCHQSVAQASN